MIDAVLIGVAAGLLSGMFGVGGGVLFVPALVLFTELGQVEAEATSLVAIIPVALVGAMRQRHYGNVRVGEGILIGVLSAGGAAAGVVVANAVSEGVLKAAFAALVLFSAFQFARRAIQGDRPESAPGA